MKKANANLPSAVLVALLVLFIAGCITSYVPTAGIEDSFERTIKVKEPLILEVKTGSGNIDITQGENGKLKVSSTFRVQARNEGEAREIAEKIKKDPPIEIDGNRVEIGNLLKYNLGSGQQVSMSFIIEAPHDTSVDSDTGSGDQKIEGLKGPVRVDAGSGDIEIEDISGRVDVNTGSGRIEISDVSDDVAARAGSGDVNLAKIEGNIFADTGSGDITVDSSIGDDKKWDFNAGSGDVELLLPVDSEFNLKARTGSGRIEIDFPLTISPGRQARGELEGKVGESPIAEINIETGSGNIEVKKK